MVYAVDMTGPRTGWMVAEVHGAAAVLGSTDGGTSWRLAWSLGAPAASAQAVSIDFPTPARGWVALVNAAARPEAVTVARTADAGQTWHAVTFRAPGASAVHLAAAGANHLILLATGPAAAGVMPETVYVSADGGAVWARAGCSCVRSQAHGLPGPGLVTGLTARNGGAAWITQLYGSGQAIPVYRSTDGGRAWRLQPLATPLGYRRGFYVNAYPPAFWGPGARDGALLAQFVGLRGGALIPYTTSDGGAHWAPQAPVPFGAQAITVDFAPGGQGWVLGRTGKPLLRSADGGRRWAPVPTGRVIGTVADAVQLDFISPSAGWALVSGAGGWALLRTADGGRLWSAAGG